MVCGYEEREREREVKNKKWGKSHYPNFISLHSFHKIYPLTPKHSFANGSLMIHNFLFSFDVPRCFAFRWWTVIFWIRNDPILFISYTCTTCISCLRTNEFILRFGSWKIPKLNIVIGDEDLQIKTLFRNVDKEFKLSLKLNIL